MMRAAIAVLFSLLVVPTIASAQRETSDEPPSAILARARDADAHTDYASAVERYRAYGERCFALTTAVLEADQPCAEVASALSRGFELARALGDLDGAERIAAVFTEHLLYAEPRESMRIGYELVEMLLDAGRFDPAERALARWTRLHPDPAPGQSILVDAIRARIALAQGQERRAASYWRRVDRRFEAEREELTADSAVPLTLVQEAVAEARLLRAEPYVERFLAMGAPASRPVRNEEDLWRRIITPWRVRTERRLLLARMELERVYELGSPQHSVVAAARIGEMYEHLADMHESLSLPEDEWLRFLVHHGDDHPGYEQARTHLEACVSWAHHHGVARRWARRCEESLHALDPARFPLPDELSGHAAYMQVTPAPPPVR